MVDRTRIALSIGSRSHGTAPTLPSFRGFLLAMEDAARRTDLHPPIDWVMFDDHGDPDQAALLAETVVADDRFIAVVGPMGSTEALANAPIFDDAGLLQVSPCASHPDLCQQGFRTFYRLVPNEIVQGSALARLARRELVAHKAAVVHDGDAFGTTVADNFSKAFSELGGMIVAREGYSGGATDFSGLAEVVSDSSPDVVFFAVHATEGLLVSSAIRQAGVDAPFLGTDGLKTSFFLGGGDPRAEAFHTHSGADFRRLPSAKGLRDAYVARWPEDSTYSPEAYDSVCLIVDALAKAGEATRSAVLNAFRSLFPYDGVTGTIRFDADGERLDAPVSWYQVKRRDGERVMEYQGTVS